MTFRESFDIDQAISSDTLINYLKRVNESINCFSQKKQIDQERMYEYRKGASNPSTHIQLLDSEVMYVIPYI